jgi:hypothetical protein
MSRALRARSGSRWQFSGMKRATMAFIHAKSVRSVLTAKLPRELAGEVSRI